MTTTKTYRFGKRFDETKEPAFARLTREGPEMHGQYRSL